MTDSLGRRARPAALAGQWYPGDKRTLESEIDGYLARVPPVTLPGPPVALVAPHAGYIYSGQIAAHAYAQLRGRAYDTVVLLGPAHRTDVGVCGVPAFASFATPLGETEIAADVVRAVGERVPVQPIVTDHGENSLEIQVPFLQRVLGRFRLAPLMLGFSLSPWEGEAAWRMSSDLGQALAAVLTGRDDVLLVASTDLSHLPSYSDVVRFDSVFTRLLAQFDAEALARALIAEECHACGGSAVVSAMVAAKLLGARSATVLAYANSGDITGERRGRPYIVGYTAAAFV